jgi:hypothetical protein
VIIESTSILINQSINQSCNRMARFRFSVDHHRNTKAPNKNNDKNGTGDSNSPPTPAVSSDVCASTKEPNNDEIQHEQDTSSIAPRDDVEWIRLDDSLLLRFVVALTTALVLAYGADVLTILWDGISEWWLALLEDVMPSSH